MSKIIKLSALVLIIFIALWQLSKNEKFQFFGNLIDRVETTEKVVALTFDDGPTRLKTKEILQILDESEIKATFYLVGKAIEENIQETKNIIDKGHEVGNHSYTHQRMVLKSYNFVTDELEKTNELITEAGYKGEIHFRPPYGKKLFSLPYYLNNNNITTVTWDVEPETYLDKNASASDISDYVVQNTKPGSIILLHVMFKSRSNSMAAVPLIVQQLKDKGYRFVTVSELIGSSA
ncbi:polysaccharide deacetylase family protein [Pseudoalteromonas sp. 2CM39R]|uniref:polysaccharide deacetylase family protein n=1 Tax=Pseudoalteromonas sp. 2CM39R TaxID=2929856 RepID=UPI0020BDCD61|nr:polysaccharide deacetylase family protein [Pseudoalteromonas sp. 2CM39R]MCK8125078.1 polysaccharide deacetylase family protein [Pseudoalteromonas sp. 2CM39R]